MEVSKRPETPGAVMKAVSASPVVAAKPMMDKTLVGMLTFLSSELVFFLLLILSYLYYGGKGTTGPNSSVLDIVRTGIFTVFLLSSSITIFFADRSIAKGNRTAFVGWLVATIVLGAIFLVGQVTEYLSLFNDQINLSRNTFGTTFFTLTGFHGLHVFVGLLALATTAILAFTKNLKMGHNPGVEAVSFYWHFVDVVWIVVFSVVYIFR